MSFSTFPDVHGANDTASSVDLTQFGRDTSQADVLKLFWGWDSTSSWTGVGQTGSACSLFDTDNDTNIDYVTCASIENQADNPSVVVQSAGSPYAFSCTDGVNSRCTSPTAIVIPSGAIVSGALASGTPPPSPPADLVTDTDPFANTNPDQDFPDDSTIELVIDRDFLPAGAVLVNVCSYPSAANGGANNPYDCILEPGTEVTTTTTTSTTLVSPTTTTTTTSTTTIAPTSTTTTMPEPACAPSPLVSCTDVVAGFLKIGSPGVPKDKLKWKGTADPSAGTADFGDPVEGTPSYELCVYDEGALRFSATVVTGEGTAWLPTSTGFKLSDKTGAPDGMTKVKLRATEKASAIDVKGSGANLTAPELPFAGAVTVQWLVRDGAGERCWSADFPTAIKNEESAYKAKIEQPAP